MPSHLRRAGRLMAACALAASAVAVSAQPIPGGSLDPTTIPKFVTPLVVPPAMPRSTSDRSVDYQIAARQIRQQVLPPGFPATRLWAYGSPDKPGPLAAGGSFASPALTIEATVDTPTTVKWINDLRDPRTNGFLPHFLPVDQTLHWANPPQRCVSGPRRPDCRGGSDDAYRGPVPLVTHLHGSHVDPESDGYPEAWSLPNAGNIPGGFARRGSQFGQVSGAPDVAGQAIYRYRNDQAAATLWYHDHALGMTRLNVYAGLAGLYLLRGGAGDVVRDRDGRAATLPGPAPGVNANPFDRYLEVPLVIQDRSFNEDGTLFYPTSRRFFDGYRGPYLPASDVSPIWNPEVFGNVMLVNGRTWPYLEVEARRYRFRVLNASGSRFLILTTAGSTPLTFWVIGGDGGFLPAPVPLQSLLLGKAERADVIVDFSGYAPGTAITLLNVGPDEPFGGGVPGVTFAPSDPGTTGQVMQLRVVAATSTEATTPPADLVLPAPPALGAVSTVRYLSLNEADSAVICSNARGGTVPCSSPRAVGPFGPIHGNLGTLDARGNPVPLDWESPVTETPSLGATEVWELYNFTADAHPIHVHQVQFEVVDRQDLVTDADGMSVAPATLSGDPRPPEAWERGRKDTVVAYPGGVTRVKMHFDIAGTYVWHCHILEHEDNEMMRPFRVVP